MSSKIKYVNSLYLEFEPISRYEASDLKTLVFNWLMDKRITLITVETGVHMERDDNQIDWVREEDC